MDGQSRREAVVCGIDPGLGTTGYAVLRRRGQARWAVLDAGIFHFDGSQELALRLSAIERDLTALLCDHHPEVMAVEELYSHYQHPRTAILMGHARGVILLAAAKQGIAVRSYAATRIKRYLTGHGRASKRQMQHAMKATLGLASLPEPADVADALAIAMCCAADLANAAPVEVKP